jgi:hypothetical protein
MSKTRILSIMAGFLLLAGAGDAAESKPSWQDEWEKTLQAAKKEGQVTIYISGYDAVLPDFRKDYPDIKVVAVTGRGDLGSLPGDARTGGESARSYRCRTRFQVANEHAVGFSADYEPRKAGREKC